MSPQLIGLRQGKESNQQHDTAQLGQLRRGRGRGNGQDDGGKVGDGRLGRGRQQERRMFRRSDAALAFQAGRTLPCVEMQDVIRLFVVVCEQDGGGNQMRGLGSNMRTGIGLFCAGMAQDEIEIAIVPGKGHLMRTFQQGGESAQGLHETAAGEEEEYQRQGRRPASSWSQSGC